MGFLSKVRKRIKKQIRPNNMMIGNIRKMPRRRGGFLRGMPMMKPSIGDMRFRGDMPRGGGFGFGLGKAIRRLNQQQGMRPQPIPRAERMPSFNPTIFGQPIGDMDFSNMPDFSQIDLTNLQVPNQMPMTQDLPEVAPIGMMPQMRMSGMQYMEPRMMMAEGDVAEKETLIDFLTKDRRGRKPGNAFSLFKDIYDFANQPEPSAQMSPEQELFSLQAQLKNLEEQLRLDRSYNDDQAVINTSAEMAAIQKRIQEILQESGRTISDLDRQMGRTISDLDRGRTTSDLDMSRPQLAGGGEPFPDLSGDGQITRKDILMGQGVKFKAEGGEMMTQENEIDAMLGGMDSEEAGAMEDLEQMAPEMEMIDQLVTMVVQMIQQGASEEEVIMFLREQGLDDEDIGTVLQLVAEMAEAEAMPQDGIGAELEQLV
jgi:hypothetical protein